MARETPINAELPPLAAGPPPRRRRRVPGALKAIAGLFLLALVFIAAAIVGGGSGGSEQSAPSGSLGGGVAQGDAEGGAREPDELGFPAVATANTTRVGGGDAIVNAASVALAVHPSADAAQRPVAVALVDADDWQGALAAAVLASPPLSAPLLISTAEEAPEPTERALAALAPRGTDGAGRFGVFALGAATVPSSNQARVRRLGSRGPEAAAAIAKLRDELAGKAPRHVVVAPAGEPAMAMPAAAWAARSGDPILFAEADRLPEATAKALRRHPKLPVYVLGPSSAISGEVLGEIDAIAGDVRRVSGEDPVANAIELARYDRGGFGWNVDDPGHGFVVARGEDPLDAAAAAPLSAAGTWGPLLITDRADTLPEALRGYLLDVKPGYTDDPTRAFYNHVWVIGDQEAIELSQQAEIDELAALAKIGGER